MVRIVQSNAYKYVLSMFFRELSQFVMEFPYLEGGGVEQKSLKFFTYPVQFLPVLTPLAGDPKHQQNPSEIAVLAKKAINCLHYTRL